MPTIELLAEVQALRDELAQYKKHAENFEKRCRKAEDKVHEIRIDSFIVARGIAAKQERDAAKRILKATEEPETGNENSR